MKDLDALRSDIDAIDDELLRLIARRGEVAYEIGKVKQEHNLPIVQPERFEAVVKRLTERGAQSGVSYGCVRSVWDALHNEAVSKQKN